MAFAWSDGSGAISSQMAAGAAAEQSAMRAQMAGELAAREAQMHSQMESARARLEGDMAAREAQMRSAAGPGQVESSYSTGGLLPAERLPQPVAVMPLAATQASYQRWEAASQVIAGEQLVAYQQLPPSAASVQPASSSYYAAPPPPDSSMTGSLYDQVAGRIYWLSKRQRSRQEEEEYRRLMSQYGHILQGDGST